MRVKPIGLALITTALLVGFGAGTASDFIAAPSAEHPPAQLIELSSGIARIDLRTGAVYRIEGDVANPAVAPTWKRRVPGVVDSSERILNVDIVPVDGVPRAFLTQLRDGRSWVLRWKDERSGLWQPITVRD